MSYFIGIAILAILLFVILMCGLFIVLGAVVGASYVNIFSGDE